MFSKKVCLLVVCALVFGNLYAQKDCDIVQAYPTIFTITKEKSEEREYLRKSINTISEKSCFAPIINYDMIVVDYLLINFASNENYPNLLKIGDSKELQKTFINNLQKDTLFNQTMQDWANKVVHKTTPRDSVSFDQMLNIAVKYFSILRIKDGNYVGKVCVGVNDIKKTEKKRQPLLEAFCFAAIIKHIKSNEIKIYDEFIKLAGELYTLNLGVDEQERLLRAQGAMFMLMRKSEVLQKMLRTEYENYKNILPFILK